MEDRVGRCCQGTTARFKSGYQGWGFWGGGDGVPHRIGGGRSLTLYADQVDWLSWGERPSLDRGILKTALFLGVGRSLVGRGFVDSWRRLGKDLKTRLP